MARAKVSRRANSSAVSAGLLAFRRRGDTLEYLLAHPGGPFWAHKDAGAWGIPKGLVETDIDLLTAARREFREETGFSAEGPFIPLAPVRQRNGKTVHAWAFEADIDCAQCVSNLFELEWPPKSGHREQFPEIDRTAYFDYLTALEKMIAYQRPLLVELNDRLSTGQAGKI